MSLKRFAPLLGLVAPLVLWQGAWAGENPDQEAAFPDAPVTEHAPTAAPEPNATLLAGLGGLALLFFALRRK